MQRILRAKDVVRLFRQKVAEGRGQGDWARKDWHPPIYRQQSFARANPTYQIDHQVRSRLSAKETTMMTSQMRRAPYTKAAAGGSFNSFHSILLSFTATASFALATLSQVSRLTFCTPVLLSV
jgi:hypothetical protein